MAGRTFTEYEDVAILVNFVQTGGNYEIIYECLERKRSINSIRRRYEDFIRYCPYRIGNWTPYEDFMIKNWGDMEPFFDPWDKLAFNFNRRAVDVKRRYRKIISSNGRMSYSPPSVRSMQQYQRGKRVVDVSYYIMQNKIIPFTRTIKEFVNILKLYDDQDMDQYLQANQLH